MKSSFFGLLAIFASLCLVGCGSTPESTYTSHIESQVANFESFGSNMEALGNALADGNFNTAETALTKLKEATDILANNHVAYSGTNVHLLTHTKAVDMIISNGKKIDTLLRPLVEKAADKGDFRMTAEEEANTKQVESLVAATSKAVDEATAAWDAFHK